MTAPGRLLLVDCTLAIGAFDYVAKPFDFEYLDRTVAAALLYSARDSARAPMRGMAAPPRRPDDRWSLLGSDVFRVVRRMAPEGRASTGVRREDTALIAALYAIGGRLADAAQALAELDFLLGVASRLGDLSAGGRSVLDNALQTVQAGLPQP